MHLSTRPPAIVGGETVRTCVPLFARFSLKRAHPPEAISLTTDDCMVTTR